MGGFFPKKTFHVGEHFWAKNVWGGYAKWEDYLIIINIL